MAWPAGFTYYRHKIGKTNNNDNIKNINYIKIIQNLNLNVKFYCILTPHPRK